jgi:hypothetical protein
VELTDRQEKYKRIEAYRKRPLIVYATSTRPNLNAMMAADSIREFIDQINAIGDGDEVDVLINSTGGDPLTAWKLMSLLRERFKRVSVLVPYMAFSAATIFALGADEIVMHPHASLGPIDPQIIMKQPDGSLRQFAYEDVGAFLRFLEGDAKVKDQAHVSSVIERLFAVVDPVNVGAAKRASELSADIGERLLFMHMRESSDQGRPRQIAENLNKSFFAHGDAVSRSRAKELQLKIANENPELEELIWKAYLGLESFMELRKPWNPLVTYLSVPEAAASVEHSAAIRLPADTPPMIAQQVWRNVVTQSMQNINSSAPKVPFSLVFGVCESVRLASECRSTGTISANLQPSGDIKLNMIETAIGWKPVQN